MLAPWPDELLMAEAAAADAGEVRGRGGGEEGRGMMWEEGRGGNVGRDVEGGGGDAAEVRGPSPPKHNPFSTRPYTLRP